MSEVSIFKTFLSLLEVLGIKLAIFPFTSGHNFFFSFCGGRRRLFSFFKKVTGIMGRVWIKGSRKHGKGRLKMPFLPF